MLMFYFGVLLVLCACISPLNGALFFPSNSAYGIFAAIAVPLDLGPHRNVFVSYNFEANYNLPENWQLPTYLDMADTRRMKDHATQNQQSTESMEAGNVTDINTSSESLSETTLAPDDSEESEKAKSRERRSLLSRKLFYNMLKQKLQMHGYSGESCLLRMICESNASGIGDGNGFFGSILHVIFAPSSSKDEGIPEVYYKAEFDGQQAECSRYSTKCPENILDLISTPIHEILNTLRKK